MEPLDPQRSGDALPPPVVDGRATAEQPLFPPAPTDRSPGHRDPGGSARLASVPHRLPMFPWRVLGACSMVVAFGLIGWQVQRVVDDQPWSSTITWLAVLAAVFAGASVMTWTLCTTENARRLLAPATNREMPSPGRAVATWILPFAFVAVAATVVAYLGSRIDSGTDKSDTSVPLAVALLCLLLAIPLTYRPLLHMAGVVRQLGGYSTKLAQWMWVPVVLAVVGVVSIALLRVGAADDATDQLAPLWVLAVAAIAPCLIVILLAWRAAESVEQAVTIAYARRRGVTADAGGRRSSSVHIPGRPTARVEARDRVRQVPGVNLLRLCIVSLLAGLALLSVIGAVVMFLFWRESDDGVLLASQSDRAWDTLGALHVAERAVAFIVMSIVTVWTFVVVLNVRLASGRRRNPLLAALAWPATGVGLWIIADRMINDQSTARVIAGFIAQAAVLYVPFFLLERAADAVGARRTPLRITYAFGVVLLVHNQGLAGLSTISETEVTADYGRIAGYLALGALVQLLSTLAVTDASSALASACERETEHHNFLVDQRSQTAAGSALPPNAVVANPNTTLPGTVDG